MLRTEDLYESDVEAVIDKGGTSGYRIHPAGRSRRALGDLSLDERAVGRSCFGLAISKWAEDEEREAEALDGPKDQLEDVADTRG